MESPEFAETDPETRATSLFNFALDFYQRFEQSGNRNDLDQSIKYDLEALNLWPEEHAFRAASLSNLAASIGARFEYTGDRGDLDHSIEYYQEALKLRPEGHPSRATSLSNLALGLRMRFEQTGDRSDLDHSIEYDQEALKLRPEGHISRDISLFNLAVGLGTRFEQTGDRSDLDQSIEYDQEALKLQPEGHPSRVSSLSNLAVGFGTRFEQTWDKSDLDQSIGYYQEALNLQPDDHPSRATSLSNLAVGLWTRFKHTGDRCDLDQSIEYDQAALRLHQGHMSKAKSLSNLAISLKDRFEQTMDPHDLDQSIEHLQEVLNIWPEGHPFRAPTLSNLALGLRTRFEQTGDRGDLGRSIEYEEEALSLWPEGHPSRVMSLSGLAVCLRRRFEQTGDRYDLDQSIGHLQEVLNLRPERHLFRAMSFFNLAVGLGARFKQTGDKSDLDQSVEYHREALKLWPEEHPSRARSLSNLAAGLYMRFGQSENRSDLDQSINYGQEALDLWPEGHQSRAVPLSNLAVGFAARFEETREKRDLDQGIELDQEVLKLRPEGHPYRATSLSNLSLSLRRRFEQTGDRRDLDQSIEYDQEALKLRPKGHPSRALSLSNLSVSLNRRFEQTADQSDLALCLHLAQEGATHESSPVADRLRASIEWAEVGRQINDPSTLDAYVTSISLLDRHVTFARSIGARHSRLANDLQMADFASDAASCALEKSLPETAIQLLERGRSILYSQLGNYRTCLVDLEAVNPELVDRFKALSARLEASTTSDEVQGIPPKTDEDVVARYQQTAAEWAHVVESIQRISGFSSFLKGETFQELQLAASNGPVVIVNVSQFRSDAIIIQFTGSPTVIPLPDAHLDDINSLSERLNDLASLQEENPVKMQQEFTHILYKTWKIIVRPIAIHLEQKLGLAQGSRLWWMPTSRACSLPLHAAGLYIKGQKSMPERFISSYTPTLSLLLRSVAHTESAGLIPAQAVAPRFLLVSQANAEGQVELPNVLEEIKTIQSSFPQAVTLDGEACTREAVLGGLEDAEWVHLACHGHRNQYEPFKSYFSLYDAKDPLTLLDIIKHNRPNAELAVLSACHSAKGDKRTPDEAVHMAAGMQFSGFKSVIGSMWASADEDGPIIAEVFYKHMCRNGVEKVNFRDSAAALYTAMRELRGRKVPFERWINFVHYGA